MEVGQQIPVDLSERRILPEVVAVIDTAELKAAREDSRVQTFLAEADAYLVELEQQDRNH